MSKNTRSPIKEKPLRLPGQSLDEERKRLFEDKLESPMFFAFGFFLLAMMDWWRYLTNAPPSPKLFTAIAVALVAFVGWRVWHLRPQMRALRQGVDGERAVGQFLERLRERGYQVFHDIVGSGFNLDHVLIGPAGVFTVETKTWSKPVKGDARVLVAGDSLRLGSLEPDRNPVIQAKAQSLWLRSVLTESTGRDFSVRPVIVFPGWYVEQSAGSTRDVWVLEPKALPAFLDHEPAVLKDEDVRLASYHLSRFIRAEERRKASR